MGETDNIIGEMRNFIIEAGNPPSEVKNLLSSS